eukprot:CAMPEP_0206475482 /NCGR_PEP_ID=MMETSP0324_2-20121206/34105_1 /ASSEMBLY_ACC=CAM_ASM_000836 /TAXON_ID=2866 /ORGANISM="Crypthecodinium cohnii, Strain Seligo" /LENGTH=600 /DNA_ID=CAMNT_0053950847 /DNA_START=85 /DNA_END=1887 /DNA_ORIENTATION=+
MRARAPARLLRCASTEAAAAAKPAGRGIGGYVAATAVGTAAGVGLVYGYQTGNLPGMTGPPKVSPTIEEALRLEEAASKLALMQEAEKKKKEEMEAAAAERERLEKEEKAAKERADEEAAAKFLLLKKQQEAIVAKLGAEAAEAASASLDYATKKFEETAEKRAAARAKLQEAMDGEDPQTILAALAEAKAAGLGVDSTVRLAETLAGVATVSATSPDGQLDEMLQLLPKEMQGLSVESAESAERDLASSMDRAALEARVVELSRYLATGRLHAKTRLEQALLSRLEAADEKGMQDLADSIKTLESERDAALEVTKGKLESELKAVHQEAVEKGKEDAAEYVGNLLVSDMKQLTQVARDIFYEERSKRTDEVVAQSVGFTELEEALQGDIEAVKKARGAASLASVAIALEDALANASRDARAELSAFKVAATEAGSCVSQALAGLPEASLKLCEKSEPVPTVVTLREDLARNLKEFVAAAFIAPGSGILGELKGRFWADVFLTASRWEPLRQLLTPSTLDDPEGNLEVLSKGYEAIRSKGSLSELTETVLLLESSLKGLSHERSAPWLAKAREVLLLRQALYIAKAQAQCLNAQTVPPTF